MEGNSADSANCGDKKRSKCDIDGGGETPTLPEFILMDEILPRLPVKSLIRFQSVSKNWLAYISNNPNFAKLHMKFSSLNRRQFFIKSYRSHLCGKDGSLFLLPQQQCSNENDLEHAFGFTSSEADFSIPVDCCNGLVCMYSQDNDDYKEDWERDRKCFFALWNPATRQCNEIDTPPGVHLALAYGFGYVSSLDDYMIFATEREGIEVFRGLYVFSLRSGKWEKKCGNYDYSEKSRKWRRVKGDSNEDLEKKELVLKLSHEGLSNDGIIYWPHDRWSSRDYIMGFDLRSDELKEYTSMNWRRGYESTQLFRLKGSLALYGSKRHGVSEFWMLKDGDDWGSWQKLFCADLSKVSFIALSHSRNCLVQQSQQQLKVVELCKEALESCGVDEHLNRDVKAIDHVESLTSPFGMAKSELDEKKAAKHPVTDTAPLWRKRVTGSSDVFSDTESDDGEDDCQSSEEDDSASEVDLEDDAEAYSGSESDGNEIEKEDEDDDEDEDD